MRILTWNLFHGRAVPPAGHDLQAEFAAALAGWDWDVALLQEVPPWWPPELAAACGAGWRRVLTSRNFGLAVRRAAAVRHPDLIKSNGGGCNAILVRGRAISQHRALRLRRLPERRWMHAVRLDRGVWLANLHAQGSRAEARRAAGAVAEWAGAGGAVLGGDFNLAAPDAPGFARLGGSGTDLVLARGLEAAGEATVLERGTLSDHAPVAVAVALGEPPGVRPDQLDDLGR